MLRVADAGLLPEEHRLSLAASFRHAMDALVNGVENQPNRFWTCDEFERVFYFHCDPRGPPGSLAWDPVDKRWRYPAPPHVMAWVEATRRSNHKHLGCFQSGYLMKIDVVDVVGADGHPHTGDGSDYVVASLEGCVHASFYAADSSCGSAYLQPDSFRSKVVSLIHPGRVLSVDGCCSYKLCWMPESRIEENTVTRNMFVIIGCLVSDLGPTTIRPTAATSTTFSSPIVIPPVTMFRDVQAAWFADDSEAKPHRVTVLKEPHVPRLEALARVASASHPQASAPIEPGSIVTTSLFK